MFYVDNIVLVTVGDKGTHSVSTQALVFHSCTSLAYCLPCVVSFFSVVILFVHSILWVFCGSQIPANL